MTLLRLHSITVKSQTSHKLGTQSSHSRQCQAELHVLADTLSLGYTCASEMTEVLDEDREALDGVEELVEEEEVVVLIPVFVTGKVEELTPAVDTNREDKDMALTKVVDVVQLVYVVGANREVVDVLDVVVTAGSAHTPSSSP